MDTFMNVVMPILTNYVVYGAIAVVTVIGVIKCLIPLWGTTHALRTAIVHLQREAGQPVERPVWQDPRFVGKRLHGSWLRFLQNAEQLDRRGLPCNVEDYINDDTVTHGPGNAQLAELIPSLLTSLGILGTFMGMTSGLSGLDTSSTDVMMTGIQGLLSGMQFAFGTSVAGVACSLVFNMLNRIAQGSSYRAIDEFVDSFTQLAMQRPLDNDVQVICQNQDTNHLLSGMNDSLATKLPGAVENAVGRALQPVARSMDNFLVGATRAQVDGVAAVADNFVRHMNDALGGQFLTLGQTLSELNQAHAVTLDHLNQSLAAAQAMLQNMNQLQGVNQDVIAHFERYVAEIAANNRRDERFEQTSADLLTKMHRAGEQQTSMLARLQTSQDELNRAMVRFAQTTHESVEGFGRISSEASASAADVNRKLLSAGDQLSRSYQDFVQQTADGLTRTLGDFDTSMKDLVKLMGDKLDAIAADRADGVTAAQVSELQRTMSAMQKSFENAAATFVKED